MAGVSNAAFSRITHRMMRLKSILAAALATLAMGIPASNVTMRRSSADTTASDAASRAPQTARDAVAAQGRERAHRDGHDVYSRVRRLLEDIDATSAFERAG